MKDVLKHLLTRIDWDEQGIATRLFPIIHSPKGEEIGKLLHIDPRISFGRPTIAGTLQLTTHLHLLPKSIRIVLY
jgi:hypothetical protein